MSGSLDSRTDSRKGAEALELDAAKAEARRMCGESDQPGDLVGWIWARAYAVLAWASATFVSVPIGLRC